MQEVEILIKDLTIELERGQKITKEKIIDFVAMLLKGDPNDNVLSAIKVQPLSSQAHQK